MKTVSTQVSHEDLFLEVGYLLLLQFQEGFVPMRIMGRQWSNLAPWALGPVAALGNLANYNDLTAVQTQRYLEPYDQSIIYHTYWGVSPTRARTFYQYPPNVDSGSMLNNPRTIVGDVGYIDGEKSPYDGPFSRQTEIITVKERYPQYQVYNPTNDAIQNAKLRFDQWQYTYLIIKDKPLVKKMLLGEVTTKRYTMSNAFPNVMTLPDWLRGLVTPELIAYTKAVLGGVA